MVDSDIARLSGPRVKRTTHDRKASADVGYRVWNPFEAELRVEASGRQDEVAKGFTHAFDVFER